MGLRQVQANPGGSSKKKNVRSGTVASGHQPPKKMNYISRSKRKSCDVAPQKAKTSGRQSGYTKSCALAVAEEAAWFRAQVTPAATVSKNEDDTMAVDDQENPREGVSGQAGGHRGANHGAHSAGGKGQRDHGHPHEEGAENELA